MKRGKNKEFIIAGVKNILERNYNIYISDVQEIDCSISIGENINILYNRYNLNIDLSDIE